MPEADRTTPQTIKRRKKKPKPKPRPYTLPKTSRPEATTRTGTAKAGPPSPQRTGKPTRKQPVARKRLAPPSTTDRTSDARRTPAQKRHDREVVDRTVREARRQVVRRRGRGAIIKQTKRELEGRGYLAKSGEAAGKFLEGSVRLSSTGGGPTAISTITRKATGIKAPRGAAAVLAPKPVRLKGNVGGKLIKDLVNLPAQALPSVYVPAAGVVEAAKGRPERIKKFAKDIDERDPVYNLGAAAVEAVGGDAKSASKRLERAKKAAEEHPGFTAVEVAGVKGAVGRGGGAVGRSGLVGKRVKRAASTERPDRAVPGTNIREKRVYSKDVTRKARQVGVEKAKRKSAQRLRRRAEGAPHDRAVELREKAARRDPDRLPEREIQRRVDERVAVNEDVRRAHRAKTVSEARRVVKGAKEGGAATSVVAQRIARADKTDLKAYVDELKLEFDGLSRSGKRANKTLRRELEKVINNPKADMARVESAAVAYRDLIGPLEKKLVKRGLLGEGQEAKAKLIPYAVRHMGATHDKEKGLVTKNGVPLSDKAIRGHMKRAGVEEPAYITQAPSQRGARNFNVRSERPVAIQNTRRTGEATRKGTFDADPETLVEGAARAQGLVDATDGFRKSIKEFAARDENKKVRRFKSYRQAQQAARDLVIDHNGDPVPGAVQMRPVRLNPFGAKKEQLENLLEDVDSLDQHEAQALMDSMREGLTATSGDGPWALIPEAAAKRLQDHLNTQGGSGGVKTLQLVNQSFRKTVLATSPSWVAGNVIEGLGRAALAKAGPGSYVRGRNALKGLEKIDPKKAEEAAHRIIGGGHFASADKLNVRRGAEQFEASALAPIANALGKFWRAPGPKQAADLWNHWTEFMFKTVNGRLESKIQTAMLGRALKDAGLKAMDDAARGLKDTEAQARFGREVDKMYGRYGKLRPAERRLISTYTPFAMWAMNSAYFVTRTLPRDHPTVTAVIAASENATDEWRKTEGLDLFIEGGLPGFLQGSIPTGGGAHQRISKYTPFGAFGDPTDTAASQVLPMMSGVLAALKGQDWTGRELRVKGADGTLKPADPIERAVFGAKSFLEATIPVYGVAKRVKEQGPKALDPFKDVKPYEKGPKKKLKIATPAAKKKIRRPAGSSSGSFFGGSSSSSSGSSSGGGGFFD